MKITSLLWSILLFIPALHAQKVCYDIDFKGFADNREYFNDYIEPQTIFGELTKFELGLQADEANSVHIGFTHLYEFGGKGDWQEPGLIAYYKGVSPKFDFYIGSFPRIDLVKTPLILVTDTLNYFRPNMEGAFLNYHSKGNYLNVWIDWLSRQNEEKNEVFLAGISGLVKFNKFFFNAHASMQHMAGTALYDADFHLRDNGGGVAQIGFNLSNTTVMDTLSIAVGGVGSYDRMRSLYDLVFYGGALVNIEMAYKGYGISSRIYSGDGQVQVIGDQFYTAKFYSRIDTYLTPINNNFVQARFTLAFHIVPEALDFSQQFMLTFNLDDCRPLRKN